MSKKLTEEERLKRNKYSKEYMMKKYYKRRQEGIELLGGKCVQCGSTDNLNFDHIYPSTKAFPLAKKLHTISYEKYIEELKKCQLLCSNCHNIKNKKENSEMRTGEKNYNAKLTENTVIQIKTIRRDTKLSYRKIAKQLGISEHLCRDVLIGKSWVHVKI